VILRSARRSGRTLERSRTDIGTPRRSRREARTASSLKAFWGVSSNTILALALRMDSRCLRSAERVGGELRITKRIDDDRSWLNGPPYSVEEVVFDENELVGSFGNEAELLGDGEDE
jgi:hypothetical protein